MKRPRFLYAHLFLAVLAIGLGPPAVAHGQFESPFLADSQEPGSVLVFPKFQRGTFIDTAVTAEVAYAQTEFEISVVCPKGSEGTAACSFGREVTLRAHWVCPGSYYKPSTCSEISFNLKTTVNGTLYFNPEGVAIDVLGRPVANAFPSNATTTIPQPDCDQGYLIVWVTEGGVPIKFDGLIGNAIIRDDQDVISARGYNAIPIQAAVNLGTGEPTDRDGDGNLDFNSRPDMVDSSFWEYKAVTGKIFGTVQYEGDTTLGRIETKLILLTLDVVSGETNPQTFVGLNFYKENEEFVDVTTPLVCWREQRLTDIISTLNQTEFGRKGLVESYKAHQNGLPVTLLGIVETREFGFCNPTGLCRDYAYSLYNDSRPVVTTFAP